MKTKQLSSRVQDLHVWAGVAAVLAVALAEIWMVRCFEHRSGQINAAPGLAIEMQGLGGVLVAQ